MLPWIDFVILSGATQNMPACFIMILLFSALSWSFRCEGFSPGRWPRALPGGPGWHCSSGQPSAAQLWASESWCSLETYKRQFFKSRGCLLCPLAPKSPTSLPLLSCLSFSLARPVRPNSVGHWFPVGSRCASNPACLQELFIYERMETITWNSPSYWDSTVTQAPDPKDTR